MTPGSFIYFSLLAVILTPAAVAAVTGLLMLVLLSFIGAVSGPREARQ